MPIAPVEKAPTIANPQSASVPILATPQTVPLARLPTRDQSKPPTPPAGPEVGGARGGAPWVEGWTAGDAAVGSAAWVSTGETDGAERGSSGVGVVCA